MRINYLHQEVRVTWRFIEDCNYAVYYIKREALGDKKGDIIRSWFITLLPGDYEKKTFSICAYSKIMDRMRVVLPEGADRVIIFNKLIVLNAHLTLHMDTSITGFDNDDFVRNRTTTILKFTIK